MAFQILPPSRSIRLQRRAAFWAWAGALGLMVAGVAVAIHQLR
ncbi:hypothetical protein [Caulobacter sp. Root1455]|nr:hypothetical protein [Caulobacter sp. Root1455]